jgi:hypothetical protein
VEPAERGLDSSRHSTAEISGGFEPQELNASVDAKTATATKIAAAEWMRRAQKLGLGFPLTPAAGQSSL